MKDICGQLTGRFTRTVSDHISKLKAEYHEAEYNYRDSGYDRYWNKMTGLERQLEGLESLLERLRGRTEKVCKDEAQDEKIKKLKEMSDSLTDDDFTSPKMVEIIGQIRKL